MRGKISFNSFYIYSLFLTTSILPHNIASLLSLPATLASQTLLVTSSSLSTLNSISLPSPIDPSTQSLILSNKNWNDVLETLKQEGLAIQEIEFALKGEEV